MASYFADTNIFIRFFLNDDPKLSPLAREIITSCQQGKISLVIIPASILEITWLLNSFYKLSKSETIEKLEDLRRLKNLRIVEENIIAATINLYKKKNIDFTDAFFAASMQALKITAIFSFDRDFDKIPGLKRLEKI